MSKRISKKVNAKRFNGCNESFLINVMNDVYPELGYKEKQQVLAYAVELGREERKN